MKINIDNPNADRKPRITTTSIILILLVANLMFNAVTIAYVSFGNQVTNINTEQIKNIADGAIEQNKKIIDNQDKNGKQIRQNQEQIRKTQDIQNQTGRKTLQYFTILFNKIANNTDTLINLTRHIENGTNQTNTLVKFLTDNFGSQSGYLERENFQYQRANQTFEMIKQILNRTQG